MYGISYKIDEGALAAEDTGAEELEAKVESVLGPGVDAVKRATEAGLF